MPWVKLDDNFPSNDKVLSVGADAFRLYVEGLCHCARNLTDGVVTAHALRRLWEPSSAAELVTARLWTASDDGYEINDYLEFNPSREQVEAQREAARERQSRLRSQRESRRDIQRDYTRDSRRESHDPDPTRPQTPNARPSAVDNTAKAAKERMERNRRRLTGQACTQCDDTGHVDSVTEPGAVHPCPECKATA